MKMKQHDFNTMKTAIRAVSGKDIYERYYKANGYSIKRYRWDMLKNAGLLSFLLDNLYSYLEDKHIVFALHKILKNDYS